MFNAIASFIADNLVAIEIIDAVVFVPLFFRAFLKMERSIEE